MAEQCLWEANTGLSVGATGAPITTAHFTLTVSPTTGGLSSLVPKSSAAQATGVDDWRAPAGDYDLYQFVSRSTIIVGISAPPESAEQWPCGQVYRSLNQQHDFTPFRNAYTGDWRTFSGSWFTQQPGSCCQCCSSLADFRKRLTKLLQTDDKANLDNSTCKQEMGCAKSQDWLPTAVDVWHKSAGGDVAEDSVVVEMTMPAEAHTIYGAPAKVYTTLTFSSTSATIDADLRWIDKTPTRLPEATLLMLPLSHCTGGGGWSVDKLGSWVDAADVVPDGGAAHLHAVGDGGAKRACGGGKTLRAVSTDSALLSVGRASPFPTPLAPLSKAEASGGLAAVLHDNIWDVNCGLQHVPSRLHLSFCRWTSTHRRGIACAWQTRCGTLSTSSLMSMLPSGSDSRFPGSSFGHTGGCGQ